MPRYYDGDRENFKDGILQARRNNEALVDGHYMVATDTPCVDHKLVHAPRTHEQRKAARRIAALGKYPGFIDPADLGMAATA